MVVGLDKFRTHFAGFESQYALIGGVASEILMSEVGQSFRNTKDFDIVLCLETLDSAFVARFWEFVRAGGYQRKEYGSADRQLYRFIKPATVGFPFMLELFSRKPDTIELPADVHLTPIALDEQIVSLSAILLDDAYYALLKSGIRNVDGLSVVDTPVLIPLKASAYINLTRSREAGKNVDGKNILKHRNDVFRLLQLLSTDHRRELAAPIKADLTAFADHVSADATFLPEILGLGRSTPAQQVQRLREAYGL